MRMYGLSWLAPILASILLLHTKHTLSPNHVHLPLISRRTLPPPMEELIARALETARLKGARYADVRLVHTLEQSLAVKNGAVEGLTSSESQGFGVRVLVGQAWGFAASRELAAAEVDHVADLAVQIARASGLVPGANVDLGPPVTSRGRYATPVQVDPFAVSMEDKMALLMQAEASMARVPGARLRHGNLAFVREHKTFANSEGA